MSGEVKITRISETRRGRFALFCYDEFLFSVDEETLVKNKIDEGSLLKDGELLLLKEQSDTRKAKDQALRYLARRPYAAQELYQKLCMKYDEQSAAAAVASMQELQMLDDMAFGVQKAEALVQKGKSSFEIKYRLAALGLTDAEVSDAMEQAGVDDEQTAYLLLSGQYAGRLQAGETEKVKAAMARRGFGYASVRGALKRLQAEEDE